MICFLEHYNLNLTFCEIYTNQSRTLVNIWQDFGWSCIYHKLIRLWRKMFDFILIRDRDNQLVINYWYIGMNNPKNWILKNISYIIFHFNFFAYELKLVTSLLNIYHWSLFFLPSIFVYSTKYNKGLIVFWELWYSKIKYLIYDVFYRDSKRWVSFILKCFNSSK